eukprot:SAG25_NODE_2069_length_1987_cov_1.970869_3_plen_35_part_01
MLVGGTRKRSVVGARSWAFWWRAVAAGCWRLLAAE